MNLGLKMTKKKEEFNLEEKLLHENNFLKRENRRLMNRLLDENSFIERTRDVMASIKPPKKFKRPQPPKNINYQKQELVVLFSDCQIGEKVDLKETQLGEYNIDIFEQRVRRYYELIMKTIDRHRLTTPISNVHIFMLGDIVEGEQIYRGQGSRITDDLMTQFFRGKNIVSRFISDVSSNFDEVYIDAVAGNHGRVFRKDEGKFYVNWDYMMYRYMEDTLNNHKNIKWNIPMSWWTIAEVQNWKFYLTHGDDLIRYMGIPWYSMERMDNRELKMLQMTNQSYNHMVIGHHHQALMWDCGPGERIVNGSFSSANFYAAKKLHLMTKPKQIIFGVHPEWGITFRYIMNLENLENE